MPRWTYTQLKEHFSNPFHAAYCSWQQLIAVQHGDKFLLTYYGQLIGELEEGDVLTLRCETTNRVWTSDSNRYNEILPMGWQVRRRKNDGYRRAANVVRVYNSVYDMPLTDGLRFDLNTKEPLNPEIAQDSFKRLDRKKAAAIRKRYKPMFDFLRMLVKVDGFIDGKAPDGWLSNTSRLDRICKLLEEPPSAEVASQIYALCQSNHRGVHWWLNKCLNHLYERDGAYSWIPASQLNQSKGKS